MTIHIQPLSDTRALLAPISEQQPCGDNTRDDASPTSPYFSLKDLRHQARALERQHMADEERPPIPQWQQLARDIPEVLSQRSKDLEFVAWYIEALCREEGFAGLARGFDLAREMIEQHWEHLYPEPDEEGLVSRIAPLAGLNGMDAEGTLIRPILSIPLFQSPSRGDFATWHCEQAAEVGRLDDSRAEQRLRTGAVSPDALKMAIQDTPVAQLQQTSRALEGALEAWQALTGVMDRVMADEPPPTTHIRKALERCRNLLQHHAGDRLAQALSSEELSEEAPPSDGDQQERPHEDSLSLQGAPVRMALASRQQALHQLQQLAEFFRQTEPHSPVSYAIGQAVRWSELSLPELMQELIDDKQARTGFCRVTGVPDTETSNP